MLTRRDALGLIAAGVLERSALAMTARRQASGSVPLGLNLSGTSYWASETPFTNLAHNAAPWRVQVEGAPFTWDEPLPPLTEDGYPTKIPDGSFVDSFLIYTSHRKHLSPTLSLHYDGRGRIAYIGGAELVERRPGVDQVRNLRKNDAFTIRLIHTAADDPIRNIRLVESEAATADSFRGDFLSRLRGFSVLRFMDWMATNDSPVRAWSERVREGSFGRSHQGVALETMIELANRSGIPPWFNVPHMADDDYVERFATQTLEHLDPALPVYLEYSNEVWNSIFSQAAYAQERGLTEGLSSNPFEAQLRFYATRTTEIIKIWERVFATQASRILGVYAAQFENPWTSETIFSVPGVADHADILAVAPYFGGSFGAPDHAEEVRTWSLDRLFEALSEEVDNKNRAHILRQRDQARRYGLRLAAYEGGQHLVGYEGMENDDQLTSLFVAANRDRRMNDLYVRHLKIWQEAGGDLFAFFASMAEPSKWGSWGLLEFEGDWNPKWDAVQSLLPA